MAANDKNARLVTEAALEEMTTQITGGVSQAVTDAGVARTEASEAKEAIEQFNTNIDAAMAEEVVKGGEFTTALNAQSDQLTGTVHVMLAAGPGVDSTSALQEANDAAEAAGSRLVVTGGESGMFVGGTVTLTVDTEIRCPLLVSGSGRLDIGPQTPHDALTFSALGGLTEFSGRITGLPASAAGRYLWIESNDVLTERNNPPSNDPYYKRSAVYVLDAAGTIAPTLDTAFSSATSVKLFHPVPRQRVHIDSLHCTSTSGTTSFAVRLLRDNTDLKIGGMTSAGAQFETSVSVQANGCQIDSPRVDKSNAAGLGYGVSIALSCNTLVDNLVAGSNREALSGRHGSRVTIRNAVAGVLDSHWGNDYRFIGCDANTIQWAGKDLTVKGGSLAGNYPIAIRSDVALATGKLVVDDVKLPTSATRLVGPSTSIDISAAIWSTPRRLFDEVVVDKVTTATTGPFTVYATDFSFASRDYMQLALPRRLSVDRLTALNSSEVTVISLSAEATPTMDYSPVMEVSRVATNGRHMMISARGFRDAVGAARGVRFKVVDCGQVHLQVDSNLIERMEVVRCDTQIRRINGKTPRGPILLHGGIISNSPNTEPENPTTAIGVVFSDVANQYAWAAKRSCLALPGVASSVAQDYTNAAHYATT